MACPGCWRSGVTRNAFAGDGLRRTSTPRRDTCERRPSSTRMRPHSPRRIGSRSIHKPPRRFTRFGIGKWVGRRGEGAESHDRRRARCVQPARVRVAAARDMTWRLIAMFCIASSALCGRPEAIDSLRVKDRREFRPPGGAVVARRHGGGGRVLRRSCPSGFLRGKRSRAHAGAAQGATAGATTPCVGFAPGSGVWTVARCRRGNICSSTSSV